MNSRMWMAVSLFAVAILATPSLAQGPGGPGGPGGFGGGFGGGGFGGGGLTEMLRRDDVRAELELVDDQVKDMEALAEKLRARMQEEFTKLREAGNDGNREDRFAGMRETMQKIAADAEKQVGEILLPHQMKRLKQLQNQMRMQGGSTRALTDGSLAEELGITDAQKEKLRESATKVEQELRQKLAELRKEAQEKLLAELTPEQRSKYKELVGDPFEFQRPEAGRGPGGPGFGGAGGGRGGAGAGGTGGRGNRPARPTN